MKLLLRCVSQIFKRMDYNKFAEVETFIFDVDGVLTDSSVLITEAGEFLRRMTVRDGAAMKMAIKAGYRIAIITKGDSVGVRDRLQFLGADPIYDSVNDKNVALTDLCTRHGVDLQKSLYMGDDLADLVVLPQVLIGTCPADAEPEVIEAASYISHRKGGHGAVRDVIRRVLSARGDWPKGPALTSAPNRLVYPL